MGTFVDPDSHQLQAGGSLGPLFEQKGPTRMIIDKMDHLARGTLDVSPEQQAVCDAMSQVRGADERNLFNGFFTKEGRSQDGVGRPPISGSSPFYCSRRLAFKLQVASEEEPAPRVLKAWYMGRVIESMMTRLVALTNPSMTWPKLIDGVLVEKEVTFLHPTYGEIKGHVDACIRYEGSEVPVEIKSHADFGYRKVAKAQEVPNTFGHKSQLNFYCGAMGVERGFYIAVSKSTGHRAEIEHHFDRELFEQDMASVAEAWALHAAGMIPDRPVWAVAKSKKVEAPDTYQDVIKDIRCGYCPFTAQCWPKFARYTNNKGQPEWRRERI